MQGNITCLQAQPQIKMQQSMVCLDVTTSVYYRSVHKEDNPHKDPADQQGLFLFPTIKALFLFPLHNQKPIILQRQVAIIITIEISLAGFSGIGVGEVFKMKTQ